MLSVCSTRPVHGAAKYSSRWRAVFRLNVATRPSPQMPRVSSTPPRRLVRSAHAPYDSCSRPLGVAVVIPLSGKYRSQRSKNETSVSGPSCISPFIDPPSSRSPDSGAWSRRYEVSGNGVYRTAHSGKVEGKDHGQTRAGEGNSNPKPGGTPVPQEPSVSPRPTFVRTAIVVGAAVLAALGGG